MAPLIYIGSYHLLYDHALLSTGDCSTALDWNTHPSEGGSSTSWLPAAIAEVDLGAVRQAALAPRSPFNLAAVAAKAQYMAAAVLRAGADALQSSGDNINAGASADMMNSNSMDPTLHARSHQGGSVFERTLRSLSSFHDVLEAAVLEASPPSPQAVPAEASDRGPPSRSPTHPEFPLHHLPRHVVYSGADGVPLSGMQGGRVELPEPFASGEGTFVEDVQAQSGGAAAALAAEEAVRHACFLWGLDGTGHFSFAFWIWKC